MCIILGDLILESVIQQTNTSKAHALLIDEVTDVTVYQQVVTFIRSCQEGKPSTVFYRVIRLIESATGENLAALVKQNYENDGPKLNENMFSGSDGASAMTGKHKRYVKHIIDSNDSHLGVWCVNHRLALSIGDTAKELAWLQKYKSMSLEVWKLFEFSPEKTRKLKNIQDGLYNALPQQIKERSRKFVRAVKTRWTSHDRSTKALFYGFEALIHTLDYFGNQVKSTDATSLGLLSVIKTFKFVGTIYILNEVFPVLSRVAKIWQKDQLNFSDVRSTLRRAIESNFSSF